MTWLERLEALRHEDMRFRAADETDKTGFRQFCQLAGSTHPCSQGEGDVPREARAASTTPTPTRYTTPATPARQASGAPSLKPGPSPDERQSADEDDPECEAFEERAAIMEYDGGLLRQEAERLAREPSSRTRCTPHHLHPRSRWPLKAWGDLRPCTRCRNLARSGRCLVAARGELRAARDYEPSIPRQPRRCIGYLPTDGDPDPRPGCERWPELIESQRPMRE